MSQSEHATAAVAALVGPFTNDNYRKTSTARTKLATWARELGRPVGDCHSVLADLLPVMSAKGHSYQGEPSEAEEAAVATLTLFATMQHASATRSAHRGYGPDKLFTNVGDVARAAADRNRRADGTSSMDAVFTQLVTATTWSGTNAALRSIFLQATAVKPQLDYVRLSRDLTDVQFPDTRRAVHLQWAEHYHQHTTTEE